MSEVVRLPRPEYDRLRSALHELVAPLAASQDVVLGGSPPDAPILLSFGFAGYAPGRYEVAA